MIHSSAALLSPWTTLLKLSRFSARMWAHLSFPPNPLTQPPTQMLILLLKSWAMVPSLVSLVVLWLLPPSLVALSTNVLPVRAISAKETALRSSLLKLLSLKIYLTILLTARAYASTLRVLETRCTTQFQLHPDCCKLARVKEIRINRWKTNYSENYNKNFDGSEIKFFDKSSKQISLSCLLSIQMFITF